MGLSSRRLDSVGRYGGLAAFAGKIGLGIGLSSQEQLWGASGRIWEDGGGAPGALRATESDGKQQKESSIVLGVILREQSPSGEPTLEPPAFEY